MNCARPLEGYYVFDPLWPLEVHQAANELAEDGEAFHVPMTWTPALREWEREQGIWKCVLTDEELAVRTKAVREMFKLPLTGIYREVALDTWSDLESAVEMRRKRRRKITAKGDYEAWTPDRFRQSVEALCGRGRGVGQQIWFRCPFHEDRKPSLEVNFEKMIWHCWGCDAKGGYIEWERRTTSRS